ncbi:MAG: FkbM family methyltransferase, partial [Spirochaetaceae bacterium]|nr:FkbM family methyltransferase [Spirochaetaceae bacterium]
FRWTEPSRTRNRILRSYEPVQPFLMIEMMQLLRCGHFIDIGANIGTYSIFASNINELQIYGFEANKDTSSEFRINVDINGLSDRVTINDFALSDHDGTISFGIFETLSGANSAVETSIHDRVGFMRVVDVACRRLDSIMQLSGEIVAIKLDVEGHEMKVIEGAERLIAENDVLLQVEVYSQNSPVPAWLEKAGFAKLITVGPDRLYLRSASSPTPSDMVAVLESALAAVIQENVHPQSEVGADAPIRRALAPGVSLEVSGRTAVLLRRLRSFLPWRARQV